jgi:ketosteroid isomerase-like protein
MAIKQIEEHIWLVSFMQYDLGFFDDDTCTDTKQVTLGAQGPTGESRHAMIETNKRIALEFLTAMSEGDADAMTNCLADDAVTITKGFGKVSGRRDRKTMLATTAAFKELVPTGFRPKVEKLVAEGDTVVLEFEGNAVLSNGKPYCNQYVFVFTFAEGKIRQLNEYFCTVLADELILPLLAQKSHELAHGV